MKLSQLLVSDRCGAATRADSGTEERFIGVNVPHTTQKFLIQQRALDGSLPAPEQFHKAILIDLEWLNSSCVKFS